MPHKSAFSNAGSATFIAVAAVRVARGFGLAHFRLGNSLSRM
jgi:hypothetical protein